MPGHIPELSATSLARLRTLVGAMQALRGKGVPLAELVALRRDLEWESGVTIDYAATNALGSPMIVIRAGTPRRAVGLPTVTTRENDVAALIADGLTNAAIAARLNIGVPTVKDHVHNILAKTGLERRTQIVLAVLRQPFSTSIEK